MYDVEPNEWTRQVWTDESHGSVLIATTAGVNKNANALLIATAPEMLEALEGVLELALEDARAAGMGTRDLPAWALPVEASIRKARGE